MHVYFAFLSFLSLFSIIDFFPKKKVKLIKYGILLVGIFLIIICGFRFHTGYDYGSYEYLFHVISDNKLWFSIEPSFGALILFFNKYGTFRLLILTIAIISISIKIIFFYKESDAPFLSILLYFSTVFISTDFGQIRQGIATSFALIAINAIYDKKFIQFILFAIVAISFHYSAIIVVPFYFIIHKPIFEEKFIYLFFFSLFFSFIFVPFLNVIVNVLHIPYITAKFYEYESNDSSIITLFLIGIMKFTIIFFYYLNKNKLLKNRKQQFFLTLYIWGYLLSLLSRQIADISSRGTGYFDFIELILIANMVKVIKPKERFIFCILLIMYVGFSLYRNIMAVSPRLFIPYIIDFDIYRLYRRYL
jgi:hypothetical protein